MESDMHVIILPWSAFGHITPFFQLSKELVAKSGIQVSFVSTPRNIQRLPKISPNLAALIHLVELPLPFLDDKYGMPEGAEATVDIPARRFSTCKWPMISYNILFKQFVADKMPSWTVVDYCPYWASDIAKEYCIPLLYMSIFSCTMRAFMGSPEYLACDAQKRLRGTPESLTSPPEWINFPSSAAFRSYEARMFYPGFYGENASGVRDAERVAKTMAACQASLVRSCHEFEGEYLNIYEKMLRKPVIPLGLLPPEKPENREINNDGKWSIVFEWLDNQELKSIVFVGFGSECKLTKDQVREIAYGLELSELSILWALTKPSWAINDTDDVFPLGFVDRTSKKGIACIGWAPQQILAHPSIGGSLFHSGLSSVVENLQYVHCLIVLPFVFDQGGMPGYWWIDRLPEMISINL